jgi:copper chaperone CopZ
MYADHHVLRVREILLGTEGVSEVQASAAQRKVSIHFDESKTSIESLNDSLASAGYAPGQAPAAAEHPKRHEEGSPWYSVLDRKTTTERKDREMAGDFRRY